MTISDKKTQIMMSLGHFLFHINSDEATEIMTNVKNVSGLDLDLTQ